MKANRDKTYRLKFLLSRFVIGLALFATIPALDAYPQSDPADKKPVDQKVADSANAEHKPSEYKPPAPDPSKEKSWTYQVFYLTNLTSNQDLNDVQTDLRNMLPHAKLYAVPSQAAITLLGSSEDIALAQKIIADLDKTKKVYRLTYTVTESDEGKRIGVQHYSIIVASGRNTNLKQGSKVPILTETGGTSSNAQVTYLDIGLEIEADLDSYLDGVRLRSKISESSLSEEKTAAATGSGDPVVRQTILEGTSTLVQGKPQVLGSLDIPGSTRHQEIEVVSELVR